MFPTHQLLSPLFYIDAFLPQQQKGFQSRFCFVCIQLCRSSVLCLCECVSPVSGAAPEHLETSMIQHNQNSVFPSFLLSFSGCAASSIKKSALCDRGLAKRNFSQVCRVLCTKLKQHGRHRPVGSRQGFFLGLDLSSAL